MKAKIEVLQPGLYSTMQDMGRFGFREYGVPESGAMDKAAAGMANMLLENSADDAVLEITQQGPRLKFSQRTQIVISGANLSPFLEEMPLDNNTVYEVHSGEILSFGRRVYGCRAYLAIKGGFDSPVVLNSRSWCSGITPDVRLEKGMVVPYRSSGVVTGERYSGVKLKDYLTSGDVEVFPGPEFDLLGKEEKEILLTDTFSIDPNNNRMGIQLEEDLINSLSPILTGPVIPGTVQLTPSGTLIVLMMDGQTTGGYPRILQLSEKGMNVLAQKVRGETIQFRFFSGSELKKNVSL